MDQTSGGRQHTTHTAANVRVRPPSRAPPPLQRQTPPPSPPYSGPIGAAASKQANAHSLGADTCYHGNVINRQTVKKPLNAFMLFMKETRHKVLQEGRERESAAINRILGHRWHALSRSEQSKYYDLAQKERLLHMQLYPGWSARDNYGKRKRKRSQEPTGSSPRSRQK
ncbi:hypothetical protein F7725_005036 [Dissostichus mawsoni]|uniref:HMG box domain-containing protein n=1 Tax=Dissostichus mawsoni TaxID=36200 RepID=A0A7J5XKG5_DISMA|nr:hypothetical protein F7725_005036 [Dissostichus mawsoni]